MNVWLSDLQAQTLMWTFLAQDVFTEINGENHQHICLTFVHHTIGHSSVTAEGNRLPPELRAMNLLIGSYDSDDEAPPPQPLKRPPEVEQKEPEPKPLAVPWQTPLRV